MKSWFDIGSDQWNVSLMTTRRNYVMRLLLVKLLKNIESVPLIRYSALITL